MKFEKKVKYVFSNTDATRQSQATCLCFSATAEYKIVTTARVDREERAEYHLVVTCRDAGDDVIDQSSSRRESSRESSREIVVAVLDQNDNAPRFAQSEFNVTVPENSPPGFELHRLNATDADFGPNAEVLYHIRALSEDGEGLVAVNPATGLVSSQISFDYESSLRELIFQVTATDGGDPPLSSSATLKLFVEGRNDERPHFKRAAYYFNVSESALPGTQVGHVVAVDADASPRYARVVYRIRRRTGSSSSGETGSSSGGETGTGRRSSGETGSRSRGETGTGSSSSGETGSGNDSGDAFEVDSDSGEVRTVRRLDRERRSVYVFTVVASNDVDYDVTITSRRLGDRPEVDVADVTVYIDDVNDNEPVFVFPGRERGEMAYFSSSFVNRVSGVIMCNTIIMPLCEYRY